MDGRIKKFFMILTNDLIEKFGSSISTDVKLSNYSWFNLGGNADYFYRAKNIEQLLNFLEHTKKNNLKITILGAGSNTLFRDKGVRGAVIKLTQDFSFIKKVDKNIIDIGAATLDRKVANYARENNLGNLEFLSCILLLSFWLLLLACIRGDSSELSPISRAQNAVLLSCRLSSDCSCQASRSSKPSLLV